MNRYRPKRRNYDVVASKCVAGRRLRIVVGALAGLQGTAVDRRSLSRVLTAVDAQRGIYVVIDQAHVELIDHPLDTAAVHKMPTHGPV